MGQGCPVQHVIEVIDTDLETLVIEGWVVGQEFARNYPVKDIKAYSVIAFEGIAEGKPEFGKRQRFLPGFCMMNIVHTGVLSMVTKENGKYHVRIEDIRIM
jgi:uncharacterized Fe-S cluster-containing protein